MNNNKVAVTVLVTLFKPLILYSKPKIFIPTKKNKNGKEVPDLSKSWFVKFSYRHPESNKLVPVRVKKGVNTFKTIAGRKAFIKTLRNATERALQDGWNPFVKDQDNYVKKKKFTTEEAIALAIEQKKKVWSVYSAKNKLVNINVFIRYLKNNHLYKKDITSVTKKHVIHFLNNLGMDKKKPKPVGASTRNSYRKTISSLFGQMVADDIITHNFVETIAVLKEKPIKNTPYTKNELEKIKNYLLDHDPYLYLFIKFVMYGFFRPVEVCRIKIKDINLERNTISVQSKTESKVANTVYITKQLQETIQEMDLTNYPKEYHIFSVEEKPAIWNVPDSTKRTYFGKRFLKVKNALNFSGNYGIYSFRHTASIDLFTNYRKQGLTDLEAKHKMLPITRHKDIRSLEKYLRDIGASLPKDYSNDYTLDF